MMMTAEVEVTEVVAEAVTDSAAEMVDSAADSADSAAEMEKVVEEMGQPKYFQSYRTNSPDRWCRTCISLETQSHLKT